MTQARRSRWPGPGPATVRIRVDTLIPGSKHSCISTSKSCSVRCGDSVRRGVSMLLTSIASVCVCGSSVCVCVSVMAESEIVQSSLMDDNNVCQMKNPFGWQIIGRAVSSGGPLLRPAVTVAFRPPGPAVTTRGCHVPAVTTSSHEPACIS